MNKALIPYIGLVEFLGRTLGESYEVILHDLENIESSVVASINSERKVGDPFFGTLTEITTEVLEHTIKDNTPYKINYSGVSKKGEKLRASSYFIRDEEDDVVGILGINFNTDLVEDVKEKMAILLNIKDMRFEKREENLEIEEITMALIKRTLKRYSNNTKELNVKEKKLIVEDLDGKGVFRVKGMLQEVADKLDIAETTIYKHLKK